MTPAAQKRLTAFNERQTDWYGFCRKCGQKLTGTLAEIRAHACAD